MLLKPLMLRQDYLLHVLLPHNVLYLLHFFISLFFTPRLRNSSFSVIRFGFGILTLGAVLDNECDSVILHISSFQDKMECTLFLIFIIPTRVTLHGRSKIISAILKKDNDTIIRH